MTTLIGQVAAGVILAGAVAYGLLQLGKLIAWIARLLLDIKQWLDDWKGEPQRPGFPARPGVPARIAAIEATSATTVDTLVEVQSTQRSMNDRLAALEAQLYPNGGGSLRDAVDRTAAAVAGDRSPPPDGGAERSPIVQP